MTTENELYPKYSQTMTNQSKEADDQVAIIPPCHGEAICRVEDSDFSQDIFDQCFETAITMASMARDCRLTK